MMNTYYILISKINREQSIQHDLAAMVQNPDFNDKAQQKSWQSSIEILILIVNHNIYFNYHNSTKIYTLVVFLGFQRGAGVVVTVW